MTKNNKFKWKKRKKLIVIASVVILTVSIILYALAYRYLIERDETPVIKNKNTNTVNKVTSSKTSVNAKSDNWNYKSDNVQISIKEETKGSGQDKITYYVADVKLKDSSNLSSAFAKNTFGRNIVETTSKIAEDNGAIFAINGDYYGFRGDGILIRNGSIYRDEAVRTAAAFYKDGTMDTFNEINTSASELIASGVIDTFSFGPVLVKDGAVVKDFENVMVDTNFGNHSIQGSNPRTGVGTIGANHFVFIVVDGRSKNYSKGMTITEFAQVFADLGCKEAYNLDGGGSSTMYFMGRVVNNPLGKQAERSISDILYIKE